MENQENWKKFYSIVANKGCETPFNSKAIYQMVAEDFLPGLFQKPSLNVLIGGVAGKKSFVDFSLVWSDLRPNDKNQDHLFFLDKNNKPLSEIENSSRLQAKLEDLPFVPKSLDLIILDFTFDFMSLEQIEEFLSSAKDSLGEEDRVIALVHNLDSRSQKSKKFGVPVYFRSSKDYQKIIGKYFNYQKSCLFQTPEREDPVGVFVFGQR